MKNLYSFIHVFHLEGVINDLVFYRMKKTLYILNIIAF
nr:MAG TPA: hypothetical protein [Bacteriophage sp.]